MARILIVEDEELVAKSMGLVLTTAGHQVVGIANDEASAVDQAIFGRPDLVLMDIRLAHDDDGIETAKRIQRHHLVPIVFISAHFDAQARERTAAVALAAHLPKPYSANGLLEAVSMAEIFARPPYGPASSRSRPAS
jgi:CheY-like chemotaxis protein